MGVLDPRARGEFEKKGRKNDSLFGPVSLIKAFAALKLALSCILICLMRMKVGLSDIFTILSSLSKQLHL